MYVHVCVTCVYVRIMYVCMYVSMYVCMYVSVYVCMHVCMYVCMYVYVPLCWYLNFCALHNLSPSIIEA